MSPQNIETGRGQGQGQGQGYPRSLYSDSDSHHDKAIRETSPRATPKNMQEEIRSSPILTHIFQCFGIAILIWLNLGLDHGEI